MAPVEVLSETGGVLPVEAGSERVEDGVLEVGVVASGLKACTAVSKLLRADRKTDRSMAQSCGNGGGSIELDLRERGSDLEVLLSLDTPLLIDGGLKFVEVI